MTIIEKDKTFPSESQMSDGNQSGLCQKGNNPGDDYGPYSVTLGFLTMKF